ncbi:hypothetical protein NPX13_g8887 [Xylaria arbuscula]|uniref:Uncharacterized protein n=1 Tax=Xylaria arbuscula TaxID=114810 RepID=A0A9W8TI77_9PEZI|nr:hypothetical protein NPX13_g8887 [Xylaria arbuscula]
MGKISAIWFASRNATVIASGRCPDIKSFYEEVGFLDRVLACDHLGGEVDVDPRVADAADDVVEAHVQPAQQQHALIVDAQLRAEHRDAVVVELALVQHYVVEEADGVAPLEQLDGDRDVGWREV